MPRSVLFLLLGAAAVSAATVPAISLGTGVDEKSCTIRNQAVAFKPTERQVFVSVIAREVHAGDRLRIDWIQPSNTISDSNRYDNLPGAPALCFVSQLPLSGFPASSQPGRWSVRAVVNDVEVARTNFEIASDGNYDRVRINAVSQKTAGGAIELILDGAGFDSRSVVHVAEYKKDGGWRYIHSALPTTASAYRLSISAPSLGAGEYLAIVRNADDSLSRPARFLVTTGGGYQLPIVAGERWLITQGPYGSFSHWGNSLQAYDIAPVSAQWVAAMRPGIAYTHDVGAVQSHTLKTFGNYITIRHDDGDFSHYAHLASGSFRIKNGDLVQAGQALAHVGNSGYTLGEGGGYHVHVHVTKAEPIWAQSVPFQFEEFPGVPAAALKNREVTSSKLPSMSVSLPAKRTVKPPSGRVIVGGTWDESKAVPAGAKSLEVELAWSTEGRDLDLRVVSPSGRSYGALGEQAGYSGAKSNPKRLKVASPEAGTWRLTVAGMSGGGEAIEFTMEAVVTASPVRTVAVQKVARRVPTVPNSAVQ